ncbi:MAG: hypothetical protein IJ315_03895 [Firmicutes bacterium]|nr:hypothetical protein [Bacillota bacterium]
MKKRFLAIVLALLLVLVGCGGSEEESVGGTIGQKQESSVTESKIDESSVEESKAEESSVEDNVLSLGRIEGGVYTNTYLGVACELDSNWSFYTAEELQELPSAVTEALEGTDIGKAMENVTQFTDMQAENVTDLTVMNVNFVKLGMAERLAYAVLSEEDIIDSVLAQSDTMIASYEQMGMTVKEMKKVTVTFLGEEHTGIWTSAQIQGLDYYILQLYNYGIGEYAATITLGSYLEDNTNSLLELFYKVEE